LAQSERYPWVNEAVQILLVVVLPVLFAVIVVWQQLEVTRNAAEDEANELASIYFLANSFSDPERSRVQDLAQYYGRTVVEKEWPLMAQGKAMDPHAEAQQVLYDQGLTRINELSDARRMRLLEANS
jgi:hypothetical protein